MVEHNYLQASICRLNNLRQYLERLADGFDIFVFELRLLGCLVLPNNEFFGKYTWLG